MTKKVVTSVKIDEDILKRAKIESIQLGIQFSQAFEKALEEWVKKHKQ